MDKNTMQILNIHVHYYRNSVCEYFFYQYLWINKNPPNTDKHIAKKFESIP